ncbi:MAG: 1-acyl-sn-glycerol-3-phosphate acyltransferase [Salinivirgaceae bacterium]|nr:1-acyl-sn-glycerol-3-phosphate acyltransferase [Salinivirgaceae bacterium]
MGWRIEGEFPKQDKYIIAVVPHTSNMDFFLGRLIATIMRVNIYFFIKRELFFFPLGAILKWLKAIPVNRKSPKSLIDTVVRKINKTENIVLVITPEGTRGKTEKWKKGFYYIARKAEIPILPAAVDYATKRAVFGELLYPGDDENKDFKQMIDFYKSVNPTPRHSGRFEYPKIK